MCLEVIDYGCKKLWFRFRLFDDGIFGDWAILLWKIDDGPCLGTEFLMKKRLEKEFIVYHCDDIYK
jgi:hypothetical protein